MTDQKTNDTISITLPSFQKGKFFLVVFLMVVSFVIGSLWTKVAYLEKVKTRDASNTALAANNPSGNTQKAPPAVPTEDIGPQKVSVDDDPVLGDKNATVTMIDFSDYECPFCKRYFDDTFAQIKKEYIDTGKIKYVYRDLPLSFHAKAHKEAQAA